MNLRAWSPILAALILAGAGPEQSEPVRIIFDSDMSSDHDDVGDIAVLHGLASMGECRILGMAVSSQNGATALCMDAINTYYGKPDIPIGVRPDVGGLGEYAGIIAAEFPHGPEKNPKDFPPAVELYRKLLAAQPDKSVTIVTTGYLNNVRDLMLSTPDAHSPLGGMDLIRKKVKLWACAGGAFPKGDEFNFRVEAKAAYHVINHWPVAVTYVGFDVGQAIYTGGRAAELPKSNPVRRVYVDLEKDGYPYPSWGQISIYQAVRGSRGLWGQVDVGRNTATPDGSNAWVTTDDPNGEQNQAYLTEISRTPVRQALDAMFHLSPNDGRPCKPGEPSGLQATAVGTNRIDLRWTDNAFNESGYVIERRTNGVYVNAASVGANVTSWSDAGASTSNASYRVKAFNATGESIYCTTWVYSGWTETNLATPGDLPLYTYSQAHLRIRNASFRPEHVTLNNDSTHGKTLTVDVDVSALGHEGQFHVYVLHQDANNWYRLNVGEKDCRFEKKINGAIAPLGAPAAVANLGNGSPFSRWQIRVEPGALTYVRDDATVLHVVEPLALDGGRVGLGGWARTPVWENFRFDTALPGLRFTAHPASQTAAVGKAATFAATAVGSELRYQWQRNGIDIPGATSPTYTTPPLTPLDHETAYRAVVNGRLASLPAVLTLPGGGLDPIITAVGFIHDGKGGWGGSGNTADKAFDGQPATFYDAAAGDAAWTGIDAGKAVGVTAVRYLARAGWGPRMIGGVFEGAASPDGPWAPLATVSAASDSAWTAVLVPSAAPCRYLRYRGPAGGVCNVAEIEFRGR